MVALFLLVILVVQKNCTIKIGKVFNKCKIKIYRQNWASSKMKSQHTFWAVYQ